MGFDPTGGWLRTAAACLLLVGFSMCVSWIFVLVGLVARSAGAVQGLAFLLIFPLTFGSSTFVPVDTMPGWLQSWVRVNPVTHLVDAVRGLMLGGPVGTPLWQTVAWAAGIVAVFAPLAVRAYRRKAA
jgi:oleandomycin transport system permease protein